MKTTSMKTNLSKALALGLLAAFPAISSAGDLYWTTSNGSITGGNGTWNTSNFWNPLGNGTGTPQNWTAGENANFTAIDAASSIDLGGGNYSVGNIVVNDGTYNASTTYLTLSNGALNVSGNITVTTGRTGANANIAASLGTVNLTGASGTQTVSFGDVNGSTVSGALVLGSRNFILNSSVTSNNLSAFGMTLNGSGDMIVNRNAVAGSNMITVTNVNNGSNWTGNLVINGTGLLQFQGGTFLSKNNTVDFQQNGLLSLRTSTTVAGLSGSTGTVRTEVANVVLTIDTSVNGDASFGGNLILFPSRPDLTLGVTKTGAGTQTFSGSNVNTGNTIVNGGTLLINGTHIQNNATYTTSYTVSNADSTLGGSGRIAVTGAVTANAGTFIAPGASGSIGNLTLDGVNRSGAVLSMAADSKFAFQLAGNGGTPDQISFWNYASGDLVLNSNAINLTLSGTQGNGTYTVDIFKFFSNDGTTATTHAFSSGLSIGTLGAGIESASIDWNGSLNNNETIALTYTVAVPEPTTWALLAGSLTVVVIFRRRRRA